MGLAGTWYNELGSRMVIQVPKSGSLTGTYESGVGTAGEFALIGSYDTKSNTTGFVVSWQNSTIDRSSTTAWCGQYFNNSGNEVILTTWLLCEYTTEDDRWESTLVGQDEFYRVKPSAAEIEAKRNVHVTAHPNAVDAT
jgi:hypothetical protein